MTYINDSNQKNTTGADPAVSSNVADALFSLLDDSGNEVILDEHGQIPSIRIGGSDLIPLKEWAAKNGISHATARQKAGRGGFLTARKVGRDWMISSLIIFTDLISLIFRILLMKINLTEGTATGS